MSIMKNEIPILEFDTDTTAVIMPTHEHFDLKLPKKAVYAFLGEHVDNYAQNHECKQVATFMSETKLYPVYVTKYKGEEGCAVVEMECSALAACARMRDAIWGEILFTADSLASVEAYDERGWGGDSFEYALELCLDAVVKL